MAKFQINNINDIRIRIWRNRSIASNQKFYWLKNIETERPTLWALLNALENNMSFFRTYYYISFSLITAFKELVHKKYIYSGLYSTGIVSKNLHKILWIENIMFTNIYDKNINDKEKKKKNRSRYVSYWIY